MNNTMEYKGYIGSVEFSEEDHCLYGKVQGIRSLISYEGYSIDDLIKDFHDAVDNYLMMKAELGQEPERPFKGVFNVRIPSTLHEQLFLKAQHEQISLNQCVTQILQKAVM